MKKVAGKPVTARLSLYTYQQLEELSEKKGLKKSAIITLAIEKYAREEEKSRATK